MSRQLWGVSTSRSSSASPGGGCEMRQLAVPPAVQESEADILSLDEVLRRERQRVHAVGVTSYQWSSRGAMRPKLLVPLRGNIYVQDWPHGGMRLVYNRELLRGPAVDPQLSPDGQMLAFVVNRNLYAMPVDEPGAMVRLTTSGEEPGVTNGVADFIAQEEMDRHRAFWWSSDSRKLAFTEVDERHISQYCIVHQGKDGTTDASLVETHHYPFAGGQNARVRLGVVQVQAGTSRTGRAMAVGECRWMHLTSDPMEEVYIARVLWLPDGSLSAEVQTRSQRALRLLRLDPDTGMGLVLLEETSEAWVNLHHLFRCIPAPCVSPLDARPLVPGSFSFLWGSERSGYMHVYLYTYRAGDPSATLVRQVSAGEWVVDSIVGVDQPRNCVYVMGTNGGPLERHLLALPLVHEAPQPPAPVQLTSGAAVHHVVMDHALERFVDMVSSVGSPPRLLLQHLHSPASPSAIPVGPPVLAAELHNATDARVAQLHDKLQPPEVFHFLSRDGEKLFGAAYLPNPRDHGPGPYPMVVSVYGGPHVQRVTHSWMMTADMRAQWLRSLGFLVLKCDNRGSARRGFAFEAKIHRSLGNIEVQDQEDLVRWAAEQGLGDPGRVGIYGWSYGGYLAAMALCRPSPLFQVAVAGAPVSSWDGYDTHYTERYMGTPQDNPEGYNMSSVCTHAKNMNGSLMLVHGLIDENVHFRHTARLINALVAARKRYDLLLFPDERHSPRRLTDRVYMEQRIVDYFVERLGVRVPGPAEAEAPTASSTHTFGALIPPSLPPHVPSSGTGSFFSGPTTAAAHL